MAFIRAKQRTDKHKPRAAWYRKRPETTTHTYYYVVESYRDDGGKVRQRTLAYLGKYPTVPEALHDAMVRFVGASRRWANKEAKWRAELQELAGVRSGKRLRKWQWAAEQLERVPAYIEKWRGRIAELRAVAHTLGIADPEALLLPDTEARREIEATVVEIQKHYDMVLAMGRAAGRA